jgi:hypothetical protein
MKGKILYKINEGAGGEEREMLVTNITPQYDKVDNLWTLIL